jgi:hypothetical protein
MGENAQDMAVEIENTTVITGWATLPVMSPLPMSAKAQVEVESEIRTYKNELVEAAEKIAKRHKADTVSAADVRHAAGNLVVGPTRRLYKHLGTAGGIMVGAAGSNLLGMTLLEVFPMSGVIMTCVCFIAGGLMIGVNAVTET